MTSKLAIAFSVLAVAIAAPVAALAVECGPTPCCSLTATNSGARTCHAMQMASEMSCCSIEAPPAAIDSTWQESGCTQPNRIAFLAEKGGSPPAPSAAADPQASAAAGFPGPQLFQLHSALLL